MRNLLISIVPTFFPRNAALQSTVSQTILIAYLVALLVCQPYRRRCNLLLQCLQLVTLWILLSGGMLMTYGDLGRRTRTPVSSLLVACMLATLLAVLAQCLAAMRSKKSPRIGAPQPLP